jgi:signal transduction histidine kinase
LDIIVPKQNDMTLPKKILILFLVFLGFCFNIDAQTISKKDSLKITIKKSKSDTLEAIAWFSLGKILVRQSVDSAKICYEKGFILSKKLNFKKGISDYYSNMTFLVSEYENNPKLAFKLAKEYEKFTLKENNDYFSAYSYFTTAMCFGNIEKNDSAVYYYEKSLALFEKLKKDAKSAVIYGNISNIYGDMKMYELGIEFGEKSLSTNKRLKDTNRIIADYINLSAKYDKVNKMAAHERCNRNALFLAEKIKNNLLTIPALINMGEMFGNRRQYDSSLYYMQRAIPFAENFGSKQIHSEVLVRVTDICEKKKDYAKAKYYLQQAMQNEGINGINYEMKQRLLYLKIRLFKREGKYEEVANLVDKYIEISDSTNLIATQERVLEFYNKLKKAESEKLILAKEVEINKQKTWIYLLSISGIALLLLGFLFYRYQNKKQEAKSQQIKLLEQENEFVAIKSSLEGQLNERVRISKEIHDDLGSSLTSISLLTEVLKSKVDGIKVPEVAKISSTSARMVDSMNEIVWALNVHNDTLDSLVAFIRKYARDFLQDTPIKLVFEEDVNQDFTLQGNVRRSIYLVVKEAINNVVKHADAQQVSLNIQANDNKLTIVIEDDGHGINEAKKSAFGNGLRNMKQRIEDIGGTFNMYQTKGMVVSIEYNF